MHSKKFLEVLVFSLGLLPVAGGVWSSSDGDFFALKEARIGNYLKTIARTKSVRDPDIDPHDVSNPPESPVDIPVLPSSPSNLINNLRCCAGLLISSQATSCSFGVIDNIYNYVLEDYTAEEVQSWFQASGSKSFQELNIAVQMFHNVGLDDFSRKTAVQSLKIARSGDDFLKALLIFRSLGFEDLVQEAIESYFQVSTTSSEHLVATLMFSNLNLQDHLLRAAQHTLDLAKSFLDLQRASKVFHAVGLVDLAKTALQYSLELATTSSEFCSVGQVYYYLDSKDLALETAQKSLELLQQEESNYNDFRAVIQAHQTYQQLGLGNTTEQVARLWVQKATHQYDFQYGIPDIMNAGFEEIARQMAQKCLQTATTVAELNTVITTLNNLGFKELAKQAAQKSLELLQQEESNYNDFRAVIQAHRIYQQLGLKNITEQAAKLWVQKADHQYYFQVQPHFQVLQPHFQNDITDIMNAGFEEIGRQMAQKCLQTATTVAELNTVVTTLNDLSFKELAKQAAQKSFELLQQPAKQAVQDNFGRQINRNVYDDFRAVIQAHQTYQQLGLENITGQVAKLWLQKADYQYYFQDPYGLQRQPYFQKDITDIMNAGFEEIARQMAQKCLQTATTIVELSAVATTLNNLGFKELAKQAAQKTFELLQQPAKQAVQNNFGRRRSVYDDFRAVIQAHQTYQQLGLENITGQVAKLWVQKADHQYYFQGHCYLQSDILDIIKAGFEEIAEQMAQKYIQTATTAAELNVAVATLTGLGFGELAKQAAQKISGLKECTPVASRAGLSSATVVAVRRHGQQKQPPPKLRSIPQQQAAVPASLFSSEFNNL